MGLGKVRMSMRSQTLLSQLKHRTGLPANVLGRYAICLSLRDPSVPNPDLYDERGTELPPHVLFGRLERAFEAIMVDRLREDGLDPGEYMDRMVRAHLNRGAAALFTRARGLGDLCALAGAGPA